MELSLSLSRFNTSFSLPWPSAEGIILSVFETKIADEVVHTLEKMKLTTEEEEIIVILDDGRLEAIKSCNLSLIGKFLMCKPFNKLAAKNTIRRAWGYDDFM